MHAEFFIDNTSSVTDIYEIFVQDNYDFYILKLLNSFSVGGAMTPPPNNPPPLRAPHWTCLGPPDPGPQWICPTRIFSQAMPLDSGPWLS